MTADFKHPVLYFDGVCNLCNNTVRLIIRHDRKGLFRFASLQSAAGSHALADMARHGIIIPESVVLQYRGRYYTKSDAVLQTAKLLGGTWCLLLAGYLVPRFLRNIMYDRIAANRYKWFGRKDKCMVPTPETKSRFLGE